MGAGWYCDYGCSDNDVDDDVDVGTVWGPSDGGGPVFSQHTILRDGWICMSVAGERLSI